MNPVWHPCLDEYGQRVAIHAPSVATSMAHVGHANQIVTFVPSCSVPHVLNGVAFQSWFDAPNTLADWAVVRGQIDLGEAPLVPRGGKERAAGVVVVEADGRIWTVSPTNGFGGYLQTFPKGKADKGLPVQAVAIKECFEETGLQVELTDWLGDFERSTSFARYYLARRIGGTPADAGWESQAVHLVTREKLTAILNMPSDRQVATRLNQLLGSFKQNKTDK